MLLTVVHCCSSIAANLCLLKAQHKAEQHELNIRLADSSSVLKQSQQDGEELQGRLTSARSAAAAAKQAAQKEMLQLQAQVGALTNPLLLVPSYTTATK